MKEYRIRMLPRAVADLDRILAWTHERSPRGAASLLAAFEKAQLGLKRLPEAFSIAPESDFLSTELRQVFFKTRRGNTYRMIVKLIPDADSGRCAYPANSRAWSAAIICRGAASNSGPDGIVRVIPEVINEVLGFVKNGIPNDWYTVSVG